MLYEAFIYEWYDSHTGKFYIGSHKGSIYDTYAHSSVEMPSFTMENVPPGYRRRILAMGSYSDMLGLEAYILQKRMAATNSRYHNVHVHVSGNYTDDEIQLIMEKSNAIKEEVLLEPRRQWRKEWNNRGYALVI